MKNEQNIDPTAKPVAKLELEDTGMTLQAIFNVNIKYFRGDQELAHKILRSTLDHFKEEMFKHGLAAKNGTINYQ